MNEVRFKRQWMCGAHTYTSDPIDEGKTCPICDSSHELDKRATVEAVLLEERNRGGPAKAPCLDPACPGCGIRRNDDANAKELWYVVRDIMEDSTGLGSNDEKTIHGTVIVEIRSDLWRRLYDAWQKIAGSVP